MQTFAGNTKPLFIALEVLMLLFLLLNCLEFNCQEKKKKRKIEIPPSAVCQFHHIINDLIHDTLQIIFMANKQTAYREPTSNSLWLRNNAKY